MRQMCIFVCTGRDDTASCSGRPRRPGRRPADKDQSLIHLSEPTSKGKISDAVFCMEKKKKTTTTKNNTQQNDKCVRCVYLSVPDAMTRRPAPADRAGLAGGRPIR